MPDFVYKLKERILDLLDSLKVISPYEAYEWFPIAVPGITAALSLVAMIICVKANIVTGTIENKAEGYRNGKTQLEAVLGEKIDVGLDEEASTIMGRTDLILQYRQLSSMEGESDFTTMEKMANVSESAEKKALKEADNIIYEAIMDFAGIYGGALIRNPRESGRDIMLAAYDSEANMEAPDEDVSNVLVYKIQRKIPSKEYGVGDTTDILTIMSGNDINRFTTIKKGSVLYTVLGKSTGSKTTQRYVCTGIEPGTAEAENDTGVRPTENNLETSSYVSSSYPEASISITNPDDERSVATDGTVTYEDRTKVSTDGTVTYSDGTVVTSDGTVTYPDGMVIKPDGTIIDGSKTQKASSESKSKKEMTVKDSSDSKSSGYDNAPEFDDSFSISKNSADITVLKANGESLIKDLDNDLILYTTNTKTDAVTITYWNKEVQEAEQELSENGSVFAATGNN